MDLDFFWAFLFWGILFGIFGGRIYHIIHFWKYYLENPIKIIKIWEGGLGIYGTILGTLLFFLFYAKAKKQPVLKWLDIFALCTPLAQSIGRWGNYFNQEVFGRPTNLLWGIFIPKNKRPENFLNYDRFHPLFLYESILCFLLFLFLKRIYEKSKGKDGEIFFLYLIGYPSIRFFLEFYRVNPWVIGSLNVAQAISILIILSGFLLFKVYL